MTCRRNPDSWCGRIWAIAKGLGETKAAAASGVSPSRLRQLANPNRIDAAVIETLFRLDRAAAAAGLGAPLFELWRDRLEASGAIDEDQALRRKRLIEAASRAAAKGLRVIAETLEAALLPGPRLQKVRA